MFGRYQIWNKIGEGGMGTVYRADDTMLKRRVALKVPHFSADDTVAVERFYREAQVAANTDHPHICPVYDLGEIGGIHYFTMPYIDGETLAVQVGPGRTWDTDRAAALMGKLARAMAEMHRQGVVHRDLKPGNIMMRGNGEPVLLDFGLARVLTAGGKTLTTLGRIAGTPAYMSPEQVEGDSRRVGPLSDVYSLGVILYQLATGRTPYTGDLYAILASVLHGEPPAPSSLCPEIDEDFDALCLKAIARHPENRFESTNAFADALERYRLMRQGGLVLPLPPPPPSGPKIEPHAPKNKTVKDLDTLVASRPSRLGTWAAVLVAVLLTAAVVAGYYLSQPKPEEKPDEGTAAETGSGSGSGKKPKGHPTAGIHLQSPEPLTLKPGERRGLAVRVERKNLNGAIDVALVDNPAGVRLEQGTIAEGSNAATVELRVGKDAAPGKRKLRLRARRGDVSDTKDFELTVDFPHFLNTLGMKMVWVRPGKFVMGAADPGEDGPPHDVEITRPLAVAAHEVTIEQFRAFVKATGYVTDADKNGKALGYDKRTGRIRKGNKEFNWETAGWDQTADHPVVNVSWNDARAFCDWLSKQEPGGQYDLPTEAEWEFVCRAGSRTRYSCGDDTEELFRFGNVADTAYAVKFPGRKVIAGNDGYAFTAPVGRFRFNAWGLYDMHGNVWEWCKDGKRAYQPQAVKDPVGPSGDRRVLRGGSWFDDPELCRCSGRADLPRAAFGIYLGFRVVLRAGRTPP